VGKNLPIVRTRFRGILFLVILISWNATAQPSHSQDETGQEDAEAIVEEEADEEPEDVPGPPRTPRHLGTIDIAFGEEDILLGATYRFIFYQPTSTGLFVTGMGRAEYVKVQTQIRPNFLIQSEEMRYLVGGGIDQLFILNPIVGIMLQGGVVYTGADFTGSSLTPEDKVTILGRAALAFRFGRSDKIQFAFHVGYQYVDLITSGPHYLYLSAGIEG